MWVCEINKRKSYVFGGLPEHSAQPTMGAFKGLWLLAHLLYEAQAAFFANERIFKELKS